MHDIVLLKHAFNTKLKSILGHEGVVQRLNKAMDILTKDTTYSWKRAQGEPVYFVTRHVNYAQERSYAEYNEYVVDIGAKTCTCPDSEGRGNYCKHRLAMELLEMVSKIQEGIRG